MPLPIELAVKIVKQAFNMQDIIYQTYLGAKSNAPLLRQVSKPIRQTMDMTNAVVDTVNGLGVADQDHFQRNVGQRREGVYNG
jgi:hypothetical protein